MKTLEPTVDGTLYRSLPGAAHHVLMINECCWCRMPHRHVVTNPDTPWVLRHPKCCPSRTYVVRIRERVGDAVPLWPTVRHLRKAS